MSGPVVPSKRALPNQVRPTLRIQPAPRPSGLRPSVFCLLGRFPRRQVRVDFLAQLKGGRTRGQAAPWSRV
jgi:hypothetical protein